MRHEHGPRLAEVELLLEEHFFIGLVGWWFFECCLLYFLNGLFDILYVLVFGFFLKSVYLLSFDHLEILIVFGFIDLVIAGIVGRLQIGLVDVFG